MYSVTSSPDESQETQSNTRHCITNAFLFFYAHSPMQERKRNREKIFSKFLSMD